MRREVCYKFFTHVQRVQIKWNINGLKFVFYFFLFMHFAVQRAIYLVHQKQGIIISSALSLLVLLQGLSCGEEITSSFDVVFYFSCQHLTFAKLVGLSN